MKLITVLFPSNLTVLTSFHVNYFLHKACKFQANHYKENVSFGTCRGVYGCSRTSHNAAIGVVLKLNLSRSFPFDAIAPQDNALAFVLFFESLRYCRHRDCSSYSFTIPQKNWYINLSHYMSP